MTSNLITFREYVEDPKKYEEEMNDNGGKPKNPYKLGICECYNDVTIYYNCEVKYMFTMNCGDCNSAIDLNLENDEWDDCTCETCNDETGDWKLFDECEIGSVSNIRHALKKLEFEEDVDSFFESESWWEFNTFTKTIECGSFFGVIGTIVHDEPNSWSSTPYDAYVVKIWLFDDEEKRDEYYKSEVKSVKEAIEEKVEEAVEEAVEEKVEPTDVKADETGEVNVPRTIKINDEIPLFLRNSELYKMMSLTTD